MIAYRSVATTLPEGADLYKEYLIYVPSMVHKYVVPEYGFPKDNSPFKTFDNTPEQYDNVRIGNIVANCYGLFMNCQNFNKNVNFGKNVINFGMMFNGCTRFNQDVMINSYGNDYSGMFSGCRNLNSLVQFSRTMNFTSNESNLSNMFYSCTNFNRQFNIPSSAHDISRLFSGCSKFNQNIIIPYYVNNCYGMLQYAGNFSSHIYFLGYTNRNIDASYMLDIAGCPNYWLEPNVYLPKYIHCHPRIANILYNQPYILNYANAVVWNTLGDGNGWYNSFYNTYLYNNYSG